MDVFPVRGVTYFAASVLLLAAALVGLDRKVLPDLEDERKICGYWWLNENRLIEHNIFLKNQATQENWIWSSLAFPVSVEKTEPRRVLVMGDSFVWGSGMANVNDTWWRQLARELSRRGYDDVEVIAAGRGGRGTRTELEAARWIVPRYKPDLIIWGYVTNDADEKEVKRFREPREAAFEAIEHHASGLLPSLTAQVLMLRDRKYESLMSGPVHGYEENRWELMMLEGKNFKHYRQTVAELGAFQNQSGLPGFVITLPIWPSREYYEPRYAKVKPLFKAAGIPFLDTLHDFCAAHPDEKSNKENILEWGVNPANGHPATRSTHFFAVEAADYLEERYPECLGPRRPGIRPATIHVNDWIPGNMEMEEKRGGLVFDYPQEDRLLYMPVRQHFLQLNLEMPSALRQIRLRGKHLDRAALWISSADPALGYDPGTVSTIGEASGRDVSWDLSGRADAAFVNTIRISAAFDGPERRLVLSLVPPEGAR